MESQAGATVVTLIFAWGAPLVLLVVVSIRYVQRRRKRARVATVREASVVAGENKMRRADRAITDPARIDAILRSATVCRLALAIANEPYVVPLSFGLADSTPGSVETDFTGLRLVVRNGAECRLYFHAASDGRKLKMLRENPRACFEVEGRVDLWRGESTCDWTMIYESIIGYGRLTEVIDSEEKRHGLECVMRHHGAKGPFDFPDSMLERTAVIRLDITELTGKTNRPPEEET